MNAEKSKSRYLLSGQQLYIMPTLKDAGVNPNGHVINFAKKEVQTVYDHDTIYRAVEKISKTGFRRLPVVSQRRFPKKREVLVGIVTTLDILDAFLRDVDFNDKITAIMNREVVFSYKDEPIQTTLRKFKFSKRGGFPVVDGSMTLLGLITEHDICRLFLGHKFNIRVEEAMTHKPFFITPINFLETVNSLVNTRYRKLPVVDDNRLAGLVTDRLCLDFIRKNNYQKNSLLTNIRDIMIRDMHTISPDADVSKAIEMLVQYRLGGLMVTKESALKGIITERDILSTVRA